MERTNREQEREQAEEWEQEQALLRAAQAGDSPALSRLLDRYLPLLQAAAAQPHLRTIREDALAEGYVSFVRAVREYDASAGVPFAAFARARVYGDVRTLFRRECRRWEREGTVAEDREEPFWESVSDPQAEQALVRLEERTALAAAMRCLTEAERRILRLVYWEERREREAALLLHVSQQAVGKAKRKALAKLRAALSSREGGAGGLCPA